MQRTKRRLVVCEQSAFKQTLPVILIYYKVSQPLLYTVMSFFLYLRVIYFTPWYFSVFFPFPIMWQWTIIHLFGCFLLYMSVKYEQLSVYSLKYTLISPLNNNWTNFRKGLILFTGNIRLSRRLLGKSILFVICDQDS